VNTYRDATLPLDERVENLLRQMTTAEKAALMFHPSTEPGGGPLTHEKALAAAEHNVVNHGITHFNVLGGENSEAVAAWHNTLQELAESTRLGIPITLSSDPRHGFRSNPFTGQALDSLSRWPETTGIAAIGTNEAARVYGDTIRQEFLAMGIRVYLGPMADIFSEPRWSRGFGTFGEDPVRVADLTVAFIQGLRGGPKLDSQSVAAVVKHFPGGGPQLKGDDAHDPRYPEQVYPGGQQELHLRPFRRAFEAGVTQVMTYYGKPVGTDWDEVGFAFNAPVVRDILRGELGFDGVVVTDWNVLESEEMAGITFGPNGWGLEDRSPVERARIAIEVGVDQFGGDHNTALIEELVDSGQISEDRVDQSVRRLLREKFRLGVFESTRVDPARARQVCGSPVFFDSGVTAQRESLVLLQAKDSVPVITPDTRFFLDGIGSSPDMTVVSSPAEADAILMRVEAPFEPGHGSIAEFFHGGTLDFDLDTITRIAEYAKAAPVYLSVFLERPAILTPLLPHTATLIADFGASDEVILDAFLAVTPLTGKLPFDMPSSMSAVEQSREDVPFDTEAPLFRSGFGIKRDAIGVPVGA
jgi:beta-glucosidase